MSEVAPEATPEEIAEKRSETQALLYAGMAPVEAVAEASGVTPVLQQTPSSDAPEEEPTEEAPQSTIEEAAARLLELVDEGHKIGDRVVDAARDELRAILGA